jgi:hypothetical protein
LKRLTPAIVVTFLACFLAVPVIPVATSQTKEYHLSAYDSRIDVQPDGSLRISETLDFTFTQGNFSFAYRDIPWKGFDQLTAITVLDQANATVPYSLSFAGGNYHIQWNYPLTNAPAYRIFTVQYTVTNALAQPSGSQNMLDWQAVGPAWQVPIQNVRVDVNLPAAWNSSLLAYSPTPSNVSQTQGKTSLTFLYPQLGPFTYYRVIVEFPRIASVNLSPVRIIRDSPITISFLTFFLVTLGMIGLWAFKGREPKIDEEYGIATPSAVPPSTLTPEEVDCLLNRSIDFRGIMGALINLGKKGYLILHGVTDDMKPDPLESPFEFTKKGKGALDSTAPTELPDQELTLLKGISEFPFSLTGVLQVEKKFSGQIYEKLTKSGLFQANPHNVRLRYALCGAALGLVALVFVFLGIDNAPLFSYEGIFGGISMAGLSVIIVGHFMPRLTIDGALEKAKWVSFLRYVRERVNGLRKSSPRDAVDILDQYVEYTPVIPGTRLEYWMQDLSSDLQGVSYEPGWYIIPYYPSHSEGTGVTLVSPVNAVSALVNDFGAFAQSLASSFGHYNALMAPIGGGAGGGGSGGGGGGGGGAG